MERDARILYDFHRLDRSAPMSCDLMIALGCHDLRVAERAAELMLSGWAAQLVVTGATGKVTERLWKRSESSMFAEVARMRGGPSGLILEESRARSTGENIAFTRDLLEKCGRDVANGLLVCKPYTMRRALATAEKQWPEVCWFVDAPQLSFDEYPSPHTPLDQMVELMVGDLHRLQAYADRGFQMPVSIPDVVWAAADRLCADGFDRFAVTDRGQNSAIWWS